MIFCKHCEKAIHQKKIPWVIGEGPTRTIRVLVHIFTDRAFCADGKTRAS